VAHAAIILLIAPGSPGASLQSQKVAVSACLLKPLMPFELRDTLLNVLDPKKNTTVAAGTSLAQPKHSLRVLLAEDNPVNQLLARKLLEKWGHTVKSAENGEQVLAALAAEAFDIILMDVQMPVLDGFATTALIRYQEESSGKHIPIIALTAHALKGDRETCMQAGMDGYVPKPIKPEHLLRALEVLAPTQPLSAGTPEPGWTQAGLEGILAVEETMARLSGDRKLWLELLALFAQDAPKQFAVLRQAIADKDYGQARNAGHKLKGSAGNVGVKGIHALAMQLEAVMEARDAARGQAVLSSLEEEFEKFKIVLAAMQAASAGPQGKT
jgi:CheY-like chemotaxis protein/HPt (histidine-containing phosphotransfer) domain-containing protein